MSKHKTLKFSAVTRNAINSTSAKKARPLKPRSVYPAKDLCSKCGLCDTSHISQVRSACAFLGKGMGRIDEMEMQVHGRQRDLSKEDELYFGVHESMHSLKIVQDQRPQQRAWTGVVTKLACEMLRSGRVDAVICVATQNHLEPRPILARTVQEVLSSGGVKPMLSPNLKPLEDLQKEENKDIKRLLFIGVGCQVQALRAIEPTLGLQELFVVGTNCVDNPRDAEALQRFLRCVTDTPETAKGFEFMQDNRIHVKHTDGRYERLPVFSLRDPHTCTGVIAKSCYSCFDYSNALTDLTVGYMASEWEGKPMTEHTQYCIVRNERGKQMLDVLYAAGALELNDQLGAGGLPREGLIPGVLQPELDLAFGQRTPRNGPPSWLAEFLSDLITAVGPSGKNFAKASIDRATLRNIICGRAQRNKSANELAAASNLPKFALEIENRYTKLVEDMVERYSGGSVA